MRDGELGHDERAAPRRHRRATVVAVAAALVTIVAGYGLWRLPGRSTQHARFSEAEVDVPPRPDGFALGPVSWDVRAYAADPNLASLRRFYEDHCASRHGVEGAQCLSDRFAGAFAHGAPAHEFVDPAYDPSADLAAHVAGEAGHCVTRSGLVSAILLSAGIPARQVQLLVNRRLGHNALEVWDDARGWTLFDPTLGTVFVRADGRYASAADVMIHRAAGNWTKIGDAPDFSPNDVPLTTNLLDVHTPTAEPALRYPEPWLYLRSGPRFASWPFRGLMVDTGASYYDNGPAQEALRGIAFGSTLVMLGAVATVVLGRRRARRGAARVSSRVKA